MSSLDLYPLNPVFAMGVPTFRSGSVLDVALTSDVRLIDGFTVDDALVGEHQPVIVEFACTGRPIVAQRPLREVWDIKRADWAVFSHAAHTALDPLMQSITRAAGLHVFADDEKSKQKYIDELCDEWTRVLLSVASQCVGKKRVRSDRTCWWYSESVKAAHRVWRAADRRRRRHPSRRGAVDAVKAARSAYREVEAEARRRSWDAFCAGVEAERGHVNWQRYHASLGSQPPALASVRLDNKGPLPRTRATRHRTWQTTSAVFLRCHHWVRWRTWR
jgi:hypothetical protein